MFSINLYLKACPLNDVLFVVQANLHHILSDSRPPVQFPLASLTAERRDVWARLRKQLQAQGHGSALSLIESALFCLCLDHQDLKKDNKKMFFGSGGDRWFDKSIQIIVGKDGVARFQVEHSWCDAVIFMYMLNSITEVCWWHVCAGSAIFVNCSFYLYTFP